MYDRTMQYLPLYFAVFWQAVQGLIELPLDNPNVSKEDIQYGSGYYSLVQFSKYIKPGNSFN